MKEAVILLLCAVALAHGFNQNPNEKSRSCNCNPSEAKQICEANYDNDNVLIAHENCDKFYKCTNGKPVAYNCPANLLYNPFTETCEWPYDVDCGDRPISAGTDAEDDGAVDNGSSDNSDIDNGWTCNCSPDEAPAICAAEGSNGVLVAHQNCNQFYKCAYGRPVTFDCPPSLLYDPYREVCDWPQNVECGDRVISGPDNEVDNDSTDDGNNENDGTCNCNPEEAPAICAAPDSENVLIAHENCDKYYICNHGRPIAVSCPENLLFDPYIKLCDWPRNVDCGNRVVPETECTGCNDNNDDDASDCDDDDDDIDDGQLPGDDDGGESPPSDDGTCNCNPEEAPSICASEDSDGILIAHENCNQFYKCDHGQPAVLSCPGNLLYNPYTEQCDWPENVNCGDRVTPDPESDDNSNNSGGNEGGGNEGGGNEGGGNCDPSEAPTICAADDSDGVLVAHENCNQFYKCSGGEPVALTCPGNLLFNPDTDQCDWPENVDCGDRVVPNPEQSPDSEDNSSSADIDDNLQGDDDAVPPPVDDGTCNCNPEEAPTICAAEDSSGTLIAHENCNQFYICDHGKPVVLSCPGNLLYNPYTEQCDWPENVDCGDRVIPDPEQSPDPEDNSSSPDTDDGPPGDDDVVRPPVDDGTCNCNPEEAPSICATEDSSGTLIAHENCNQFYICDHGKPVVLSCPGNLLYNPYTEQCDWPENVDCGDRVIPDPEQSPDPEDNSSSPDTDDGPPGDDDVVRPPVDDGTCNCNPEEAPSICATEDSSGTLIAHENCNQFYICDHGKPVVLSCPGNLLYNPYTEQCDWPENVDCGDRVIPDPEQSPDPEDNSSSPDIDDGPPGDDDAVRPPVDDGTCNCNPEEAPTICAAEDSSGTLIAHENCNQFYICDHGKPVVLSCPGNLLYNPYTEQCDWPENVDCGDRVIPDPEQSPDPEDNSSSADIDDNLQGDDDAVPPPVDDGTCNCNPEEAPTICAAEDSSGTLIAHENCNQFYICDHGKPVVLSCPGNLLYNPYTEQCDWPENVDCGDRVIPDPEQSPDPEDNSSSPDTDDGPPGDDDVVRPPVDDGTCNCNPEEAPSICATEDSSGTLIAHENCNQFYICDHGKPVVLSCPGNLLYNPYTEQCDWPENVDCGDRVIPDPEQSPDPEDNSSSPDTDDGPPGDDDAVRPPVDDGTCNCNPEEAASICSAEDSSGTLIAHENCNQFYICDHGKPVVLSCPGNLLYNPYTEQCDWPENVDCGDRVIPDPEDDDNSNNSGGNEGGGNEGGGNEGGGNEDGGNEGGGNCDPSEAPTICAADGSDGVLVAHENCNQFYKCSGGEPVALTCPGNLLFNPNTDQCDWPENVDCGDRVVPDPEQSPDPEDNSSSADIDDNLQGDDDGDNDTNDSDCSDDTDQNDGTCNCNPDEAPSICAIDNSDGIHIAHENCNQFYKCDNGKPVPFKCPSNLLYNPITEVCDWPFNVECGDRVIPDTEDDTDNNASDTQEDNDNDNDNVGSCNCNPAEAPAICAVDGSSGVQIAHENCNQFYMCDHGIPVAFTCNGFLLYNPYTQRCDWPANVECGDRVIPDPGEDNDDNDNDVDDNNNNNDVHDDPSQAPLICADSGSEGVLVAHENCDQYYICSGGVPVSRPCAGGLLFNPLNQQCDWPQNVNCGDRIVPGGDDDCACNPRNAPALCARQDSEGKLIAHENCNQFYMCASELPIALSCPDGLYYNIDKELCDWPENVDCSNRLLSYTSLNKHWQSRQTLRQ